MTPRELLGKIAYEAYANRVDAHNMWEHLNSDSRDAWLAAGDSVRRAVLDAIGEYGAASEDAKTGKAMLLRLTPPVAPEPSLLEVTLRLMVLPECSELSDESCVRLARELVAEVRRQEVL